MKTVASINISPVKSLGLIHPTAVQVSPEGIEGDRRFFLIDQDGRILTQRELGQLVKVKTEYQAYPERLNFEFPEGATLEGLVELGEPVSTRLWGRHVQGHVVKGDWQTVLSDYCGRTVNLVKADLAGTCQDEYPISLMSQASLEMLSQKQPSATSPIDYRRFRPSFLLTGCEPHEEDTWLEGTIQIGEQVRLNVIARDPRCVITTHNPDTGETDLDTLRLILSYRPNPRAAYFGVYGMVEQPGLIALGDSVTFL